MMLTKHNANQVAAGMPAALNDLVKAFFGHFPEWNSAWLAENQAAGMEVEVHDHDVTVKLPFPGCSPKDFEIEVVGDFLTVKAQRNATSSHDGYETKHFICRERSTASYEESIRLPVMVRGSNTKAKYVDGVLTLTIPRATNDGKRSKVIKVG